MATHKELITSGKFNEKFKRALLDYYSYGFKNLGSFDEKRRQTLSKDWLRLNRVILNYMEWSKNRNEVMFASADSQSMDENPFHRVYRFCKYKHPAYFLHSIAALSHSFELREGVDALDIDEDSRLHLEDLINGNKGYKTSDLLLLLPELEKLEDADDVLNNEGVESKLSDSIALINSAIGKNVSLFTDVKQLSFKYIRTSVLKSSSQKNQHGKDYVVSPYCIQLSNGVVYLLAYDNVSSLRAFRVDHMVNICVLDLKGYPLNLALGETLQDRFDEVLTAQRHNNAVKALTGRLDELGTCGFVRCFQRKGKSGKIGDRWWSLPELTMRKILDSGLNVDEGFEHHLLSALDFFSKYYLFGEVGTLLLDRICSEGVSPFRFKHEYFMQSLNDFNIIDLLYAIENGKWCKIKYSHGAADFSTEILCYPLEIRISNMQGREFLMYYEPLRRSYTALRIEFIDSIEYYDDKKIRAILTQTGYHSSSESVDADIANARNSMQYSWGVATTKIQDNNATEPIEPHLVSLQIAYNPETDYYIVNRLNRECRFGVVSVPDESPYLRFSINVSDEVELRPWMRSFYSRIMSCDGMDTEIFSLDADVEKMVGLLLQDRIKQPQTQNSIPNSDRWIIPDSVLTLLGNGTKAREHDLLFNEAFSIYYYIIADVFAQLGSGAEDGKYTERDLDEAITRSFSKYYIRAGEDTEELIPSKIKELLINGGFLKKTKKVLNGEYEFVRSSVGGGFSRKPKETEAYLSKYKCPSGIEMYRDVIPLSKMELRWLKTIISDKDNKIKLFMSDSEIDAINSLLNQYASGLSPVPMDKVIFYDRFQFSEKNSKREALVFATLLEGIYDRKTVRIKYHTMKKRVKIGEFRPIVLEFSKRNNRFQGFFQECGSDRIYTMNVARIETAVETDASFDYAAAEQAFVSFREENTTSVEIEFYDVRNIADRILTEFSPWKKRCSYDPETGLYRLRIFYQKQDEVDLVIRLLGYGATLRFTDKEHPIYKEIQSRINRQMELIRERRRLQSDKEQGDNR